MRVSGHYIERLIIFILPTMILVFALIYFSRINSVDIWPFLIGLILFWFLDTIILIIKYRNPKSLYVIDDKIRLGKMIIKIDELRMIRPVTDARYKWYFNLVEISFKSGKIEYVLDKPQDFISNIFNEKSKTINSLLKSFPELETLVSSRVAL